MRGRAKPSSSSPRWCAPTAPSTKRRTSRLDIILRTALPKDLGDWAGTAAFVLGPSATGKDLKDLSVIDKARAQDRSAALACRQGLGTLIAKLGEQVPLALSTPARAHHLEQS